jgi:hypothetical protein
MKCIFPFLLLACLSSAVWGQKKFETALTFKIGNYTTPFQLPVPDYYEGFQFPREKTLPGYVGMVGVQERFNINSRWSIAADLLYGFAEYGRRDIFKPCIFCDCFGPCGDVQDSRYALYQVLLPVHAGFRWSQNRRWMASLGVATSYTLGASQSNSSAWLGSTEPKQTSPTKPIEFNQYNSHWQWLAHGAISCRISKRTHIGLETFWNPRPHAPKDEYGWNQTTLPPGVMKNVSLAVRNVLGSTDRKTLD